MLSNLNIPLYLPSNRRTARRLLYLSTGFAQALSLILLITFFVLAPRPTHAVNPHSLSLWFAGHPQDLTFFEKHLGSLQISDTNLTLFEIFQVTNGPYTLTWNNSGRLVNVSAQKNSNYSEIYSSWQKDSIPLQINNHTLAIGQPQELTRHFWPHWPWHTGTLKLVNSSAAEMFTYRLQPTSNKLIVEAPLLERTTSDLNDPYSTAALALTKDQSTFWANLELPLSFPGLSTLMNKLSTTNSTINLTQSPSEQKLNLALQAPLNPEEALALLNDLLLGSTTIIKDEKYTSNFTYFAENNHKFARIIVTPQSTGITLTLPGNAGAKPVAPCLKNPLARLSLPQISKLLPNSGSPISPNIIIESNRHSTALCFVDN